MKRIGAVLFLCLFLISFVSAVDLGVDDLAQQGEEIQDNLAKIEELSKEDEKWGYIGKGLLNITLKNPVVKAFDTTMNAPIISVPFKYIFGINYSFSLLVLISVILWIFFLVKFNELFSAFSSFSGTTSFVVSFCFILVLAQLSFYSQLAELIFKLIFYREGWWGWISTLIVIVVFVFIGLLAKAFASQEKSTRVEDEERRFRGNREVINTIGEALSEGLGSRGYVYRKVFKKKDEPRGQSSSSSTSRPNSGRQNRPTSTSSSNSGRQSSPATSTLSPQSPKRFKWEKGMRRGGTSSHARMKTVKRGPGGSSKSPTRKEWGKVNPGSFISDLGDKEDTATARYVRRFGDEAANKRFGKKKSK